jgi:hypothetical protein
MMSTLLYQNSILSFGLKLFPSQRLTQRRKGVWYVHECVCLISTVLSLDCSNLFSPIQCVYGLWLDRNVLEGKDEREAERIWLDCFSCNWQWHTFQVWIKAKLSFSFSVFLSLSTLLSLMRLLGFFYWRNNACMQQTSIATKITTSWLKENL